ncbi:MAG: hypothetical protein FJ109_10475 [Deltaproteobacteria bacterium]|nr:hypothetical protein [Deltaproteobacteria bacterium]
MRRPGVAIPVLVALLLAGTTSAAEELKIYKNDQFPGDINQAAQQISGIPLATQPGFVKGEAFGAVFHPDPSDYPVKIQGVDLFMAKPPNGGKGEADAYIEIYFHNGSSADPGKATPDFSLSTYDVFNPMTMDFGMPIQGNTAMQFQFDWGDSEGHPPILTEGSFTVMIRFMQQSESLTSEWGSFQCQQMADLGMCGCQQVGTLNDQATTKNANVMHIIYPPGNCNGAPNKWLFAESVGVTGDFIVRAPSLVTGGGCTPDCTGKKCGSDGCGGTCGQCGPEEQCVGGECKPGDCNPQCVGKECGDDGCGGVCGTCAENEACVQGQCEGGVCQPKCDGKECGDDSCGGVCGLCAQGETCVAGACQAGVCQPQCTGKECGDDSCGGVCGACAEGKVCEAGLCKDSGTDGKELTITGISPDFGYNDEDTSVSIVGTGFKAGATVKLGGTDLNAVQVISEGLISAKVPEGMEPDTYMLIVANSDGKTASLLNAFTVKEQEVIEPGAADSGCNAGGGTAGSLALLLAALAALTVRRRHA